MGYRRQKGVICGIIGGIVGGLRGRNILFRRLGVGVGRLILRTWYSGGTGGK